MPALGPWELGIILLIVVVIFGAGKLPEIGGALGKSIREFKASTADEANKKDELARTETTVVERPTRTEVNVAEKQPLVKDETVR